jgi:hypothetical protein
MAVGKSRKAQSLTSLAVENSGPNHIPAVGAWDMADGILDIVVGFALFPPDILSPISDILFSAIG